jgi:hypothetical protein
MSKNSLAVAAKSVQKSTLFKAAALLKRIHRGAGFAVRCCRVATANAMA